MKITSILAFCKPLIFGGVGIGAFFGVAATGINAIHSGEIAESPIIEGLESPVLESPVAEPQEEVKEVAETKDEPSKTEVITQATTHAQTTKAAPTAHQPTTKPAQSTPKVEEKKEVVVYSILGHKRLYKKEGRANLFDDDGRQYTPEGAFTNINDFEKAAVGLCPNQVPAGAWPDKLRPGVALGITGSPQNSKDPLAWADHLWSAMKSNPNTYTKDDIWLIGGDIFDSLLGSEGHIRWDHRLGFTIDWSTLTVDWRRIFEETYYKGKDGISENSDAYIKMETAAKQMTARIRQRNAEFKAKCGY